VLAWQEEDAIAALPLWEGDRVFLELLRQDAPFFSLKLCYDMDDRLTAAVLDGKAMNI